MPIDKGTLDNGLRVVLSPEPGFPSVAIALAFGAGPAFESKGQEGYAKLVAQAHHAAPPPAAARARWLALEASGAASSVTVSRDLVVLVRDLPRGEIELGLWLEAERLRNPRLEEDVLTQARRDLHLAPAPAPSPEALQPARARLEELVFQGYWPYEHDALGPALAGPLPPQPALLAFRRTYYAPNNAVLAISGDFEPDEAMRMVHRQFDPVPRQPDPPVFNPQPLPDQTNQRSGALSADQVRHPAFVYGWAVPSARQAEHDALRMAAWILGSGPGSRLGRRLESMRRAGAAPTCSATVDSRRGPGLLTVEVGVPADASLVDARRAADDEIDALARLGPSTTEMRQAWHRAQWELLDGLAGNRARAERLAALEATYGDARLVHAELGRILSIGKDDVRKAVARYLSPTRRTLVEVNAPAPSDPRAAPPAAHAPAPAPHLAAPRPPVTPPKAGHDAASAAKKKPPKASQPPKKAPQPPRHDKPPKRKP